MKHEDELPSGSRASVAPLDGLKILELGQLIAGPFAGKTLAEFGADVIKVEPPARDGQHGGDPLRRWRLLQGGSSLWWEPAGRIYTAADIYHDPQYIARGMIQKTRLDNGRTLALPGVVPKLSLTPGTTRRNAPGLGQDTDEVLRGIGLRPTRSRHSRTSSSWAGSRFE